MKEIALGLAVLTLVVLGACRGGRGELTARLEEIIPTVAGQIGETLLGAPVRSLTSVGEPPLLGSEGRERVVLAVDTAAFASLIGEKVKPEDVLRVVERINQTLDRALKRRNRRFSSSVGKPTGAEGAVGGSETVVATVTPYLLPTGGPQAPPNQRREALLMARLSLSDAHTGRNLAAREFFTGYSVTRPAVSP